MQKRLEVERTYFSLFPQTEFVSLSSMYKCKYVRCYICQIYLLRKNEFTFAVCDKTYKVRGKLNCNSYNDIDFINCKLCVQDKQVKHLYIYIDIRNANFKCVTLNIYEKKTHKIY